MPYNEQETKKKSDSSIPTLEDGQVGIRATLNSMGFSNNRIGYNEKDGTVTLDNRTLMKPGYLDEAAGVSYASKKDIQKSLTDFYKDSKDPIVRVSDAFSASAGKWGLTADALTYGNDTVSIGGAPLDILYIDDEGKSWAFQSTVEDSVADYANSSGVRAPLSLVEEYQNRYLDAANDLLYNLQNRKEFSYDPESDPVYLAYKNQYLTEGDRASRNAMANYATLTGGYANSAAATAAAQAELYYAQQLTNTIPKLAEQAYQRYQDSYQNDVALLEQMVDLYDTAYTHAAAANTAQRENANTSAASNVQRDKDAHLQMQKDALYEQEYLANEQAYLANEQERLWEEYLNAQTSEKNILINEGLRLDHLQQSIYQKYYEQLLQAELAGMQLDQKLTEAKIYQAYR